MKNHKRKTATRLRAIILNGHYGELSVSKAAEMLNIGRPNLSNVLNGKAELSIELAQQIEWVFKYDALELLKMQLEDKFREIKEKRNKVIEILAKEMK